MSEEKCNKRRLGSDNSNYAKKVKQYESNLTSEDLNYLKENIKSEITKTFETRISKLEEEIERIKKIRNPISTIPSSRSEKAPTKEENNDIGKEQESVPAKFGSTSMNLNPNNSIATPLNSFTSNADATPTAPNTSQNSPKHVFGATSSFSNASVFENLKNKKNVFESEPSKSSFNEESKEEPAKATYSSFGTSTFGSNSKFSNAFQAVLKKKSFLDEDNSTKEEGAKSTDSDTNKFEKGSTPQQYKQVDLALVEDIKTGEENEESRFTATAKMFELNLTKISDGWKERGLGPLHLNQSLEDPKQVRLVMRSQGLLRVILNMNINPGTKLLKGLEASLSPEKYLRLNSVNEKGDPVQYLLKFGSQALRDQLTEKIEQLQKAIKDV